MFQIAADARGFVAPFDVSAIVLICMMIAITLLWNENYGNPDSDFSTSFYQAIEATKKGWFTKYIYAYELCTFVVTGNMRGFMGGRFQNFYL